MRRTLFTLLSALSLLCFLATVLIWVRSYWVRDMLCFGTPGGNSHIAQSILGRLHCVSNLSGGYTGGLSYAADRLSPNAIWNGGMSGYPPQTHWHFGCVFQTYTRFHMTWGIPPGGFSTAHRLIVIPYWLPALLFALPPTFWVFQRYRRAHNTAAGLCPRCGYDLRASKDRCPECGAPIPPRPASPQPANP